MGAQESSISMTTKHPRGSSAVYRRFARAGAEWCSIQHCARTVTGLHCAARAARSCSVPMVPRSSEPFAANKKETARFLGGLACPVRRSPSEIPYARPATPDRPMYYGRPLSGPRRFSCSSRLISRSGMRIAIASGPQPSLKLGRPPRKCQDHRGFGPTIERRSEDGQDASSSTGKSGSSRSMSASCGVDARGRMPRLGLPRGMRQPG